MNFKIQKKFLTAVFFRQVVHLSQSSFFNSLSFIFRKAHSSTLYRSSFAKLILQLFIVHLSQSSFFNSLSFIFRKAHSSTLYRSSFAKAKIAKNHFSKVKKQKHPY